MTGTRRKIGILLTFLTLASLGWQILAIDRAPAASAVEQLATPIRLGWTGGCGLAAAQVGLYQTGDLDCQPDETMSLAWLQAQVTVIGLIDPAEYLEASPPDGPCPVSIYRLDNRSTAGQLCLSAAGAIYRADAGGGQSARWQYLRDGTWAQAETLVAATVNG